MNSTEFYKGLFDRLVDAGIRKLEDLHTIQTDTQGLTSKTHPWVSSVFHYYNSNISAAVDRFLDADRFKLLVTIPGDWTPLEPEPFYARANYAGIFPAHTVFVGEPIRKHHWDGQRGTETDYSIPMTFLHQLLVLKPLLLAGFTSLLPQDIRSKEAEALGSKKSFRLPKVANGIEIYAQADDREALSRRSPRIENSIPTVLRTPWLRGIDLDRYVDLALGEVDAFDLYNAAVTKLLTAGDDPAETLQDALQELNIATLRLTRAYSIQRRKLNFQGLSVSIGSIIAAGSSLVPDIKPVAAAIGGATAMQAVTWIRDRATLRREVEKSDYWFLWRSLRH